MANGTHGMDKAGSPSRRMRYHFDEAFFDVVDSELKAYWLGFITADGYVRDDRRHRQLVVKLKNSDVGHLEKLRFALKGDHPIRFSPRSGVAGPAAIIAFSSRHLVESLAALGVGPRKSATVEPWKGPADLMRHYWRGLFDGDGSIGKASGRNWQVTQCGSKACIDAFGKWVCTLYESNARAYFRSNIWYWKAVGVAAPQALIDELYREATVYLDRKRQLALQLLAQPVRARSWRGQPCSREGCTAEATVMGKCQTHYRADWYDNSDRLECEFDGCPERQIARGYCTKHYLRNKKYGDPTRVDRPREGSRRIAINDSFFNEIDTAEKAYWLGFTAASASVVRSTKTFQVRFELRANGEEYLAKLRDALGSARELKHRTGAQLGALVAVTFDSWRLVDALERHGVTTRKGMTVTAWNGPASLMPQYWRGIEEGSAYSLRQRVIPQG